MSTCSVKLGFVSDNKPNFPVNRTDGDKFKNIITISMQIPKAIPNLLKDHIVSIAECLEHEDISVLSKVSKFFRECLDLKGADNPAAQILLAQVKGCKSLTSMKTLRSHVSGLKKHCPDYLGKGKEWSLVEVLKCYDLKSIDFSEDAASSEEMEELFKAFEEISRTTSPKSTLEIPAQARSDIAQSLFDSLDEQYTAFILFSGWISEEDEQIILQPEWEDEAELIDAVQQVTSRFLRTIMGKTPVEFATRLQEFLEERQPELRLVEEARTQDIFGDITVFCSHACHPNEQLLGFLRAFCPKLKKLAISCVDEESERTIYRFFSASDRRNTIVSLRFLGNHPQLLINNKAINELNKLHNDFFVNQQKLEDFPFFIIESRIALKHLISIAPSLTGFNIFFRVMDNEKIRALRLELMRDFAQKYTNLKFLALNIPFEDEKMSATVKDIIKNNKKLRSLGISGSYSDKIVENLLPYCENLKSLAVPFVSNQFLATLPILFPHLQEFTHSDKPISDRAFVRLLMHNSELVHIHSQNSLEHIKHIISRIFCLRNWNCMLKYEKYSWRKLLTMMGDWDKELLHDLHRLIWLHEGASDMPEYGRKALASDLSLVKTTKPILSLHGNLIEQLAVKQCIEAECILIRKEIMVKTDFIGYLAGGPWTEGCVSLIQRVTQILTERHGNDVGNDYFCDMMNGNASEDGQFVSALFTGEIQSLQKELDQIFDSYEKNKLQALQILLKDGSMNQTQLLEIYKGLSKNTRDKLAYGVWKANGSPDEERFGEKLIHQNVRVIDNNTLQSLILAG